MAYLGLDLGLCHSGLAGGTSPQHLLKWALRRPSDKKRFEKHPHPHPSPQPQPQPPSEKAQRDLGLGFLRTGTWLSYIWPFRSIVRSDPSTAVYWSFKKKKKKATEQNWPCILEGSLETGSQCGRWLKRDGEVWAKVLSMERAQ